MSKVGRWDGAILGGVVGLLAAYPSIATSINGFLVDTIPTSWDWFGTFTSKILIIAVGIVIGLIIDKTR